MITLAFEKLAGPVMSQVLDGLKAMATDAKRVLVDKFGEGSEQATAHLDRLQEKLMAVKGTLLDLEIKKEKNPLQFNNFDQSAMDNAKKQIAAYTVEVAKAQTAVEKYDAQEKASGETTKTHAEQLKEFAKIKNELAEAGVKLAEKLTEFSPETVQKEQLEELKIQLDDHLISVADYYAMKADIDGAAYEADQIALEEALMNKQITEEKYAKAIEALDRKKEVHDEISAAQQKKADQAEQQEKLGYTSKFFGDLSTLQRTKSKELYDIGKAAAVAQAVVDGYAAVQKTLASVPYPFSIPLAAAAGIAAAANVASIVSAPYPQFAKGVDSIPGIGNQDNFPAMLAPGERVVPKKTNQDLTSFLSGGGGGVSTDLLGAILARLNQMNLNVQLALDGRVLFEGVNDQIKAGRRFAD